MAILPTIRRDTSRSMPGKCVERMIQRRRSSWARLAGRNFETQSGPKGPQAVNVTVIP